MRHTDVNTGQRLLHPSCMHYLSGACKQCLHAPGATWLPGYVCASFGLRPAPQKGISDSFNHTTSPPIASKSPLSPTVPIRPLPLALHLSWTPSVCYVAYCNIIHNPIVSFVDDAKSELNSKNAFDTAYAVQPHVNIKHS